MPGSYRWAFDEAKCCGSINLMAFARYSRFRWNNDMIIPDH